MKIETNGDFVSTIRNDLKALNKDDYISARYILSVGRSYSDYIINNRPLSNLFRDSGVFNICDCVELKRIDKFSCDIAEFRNCNKMMKSKNKLKILVGRNGLLIEFVSNIVNGEEYEPLRNAMDYNNSKKRQFGDNFKYYYIDGEGYLYLLNSTAERVNISAAFLEKCKDCEECDECLSMLEQKFILPDEYMSTVLEQTLNRILGGNKKIVEDTNPDSDNNQKGKKQ